MIKLQFFSEFIYHNIIFETEVRSLFELSRHTERFIDCDVLHPLLLRLCKIVFQQKGNATLSLDLLQFTFSCHFIY